MKKQIILLPLLLALASYTGQSQGTLLFQNRVVTANPPINAPIAYEGAGPAPAGRINGMTAITTNGYTWGGIYAMCAVYAGPVGASEDELVLLAPAVGFRTGTAAGYVNPGIEASRTVPNVVPGAPAVAQLRAWDVGASGVTSYEGAVAISQSRPVYLGKSALINISALGGGGVPPLTPAPLLGLTAFNIYFGVSTNSPAPIILMQPQSQTVQVGSNAFFSCTATGTPPLSYLWYYSASAYPIGSNSTLLLPFVQTNHAGTYYVEVSNSGGTVRSSYALLTVLPGLPPGPPSVALVAPTNGAVFNAPNPVYVEATATDPDGWVNEVHFYANSNWIGWTFGPTFALPLTNLPYGPIQLTAMAIDNDGNQTMSDPVQITYNPPTMQPPIVQLTNPPNGAVFGGPGPLFLGAFATDPDGTIARVEFYVGTNRVGVDTTVPYSTVTTNLQYGTLQLTAVAVDNDGNRTVSEPVSITVVATPPVIITQPRSQTVTAGGNALFSCAASGATPLFYRWYFEGSPYPIGSNSTLSIYNVQTNHAGTYYVVVSNAVGTVTSTGAVLTVLVNTNPQPPVVSMTAPLNGAVYTAPLSIYMAASASDADGGITKVEFYVGTNRVAVDTNSPYYCYWTNVTYGTFQLTAVATDNSGNVTVSAPVNITVNPRIALQIIQQPQSQIVPVGTTNVTFSVMVTGSTPLFYRWYFNGNPVSGGTNSFYRIPVAQTYHAGTYYVVVSNTVGKATSSNAALCVITTTDPTPPTISVTSPGNGAVIYDPFSVLLSATANDPDGCITGVEFFIDGVSVGQDAMAPYNRSWTNFSYGTYQVTAAATDNDGNVTVSTPSSFTISPRIPPTIVTQPASQTVMLGGTATFTVEATGTPMLLYRWFLNGAPFAMTTNGILTLVNVQTNHAGWYYVVVSNSVGGARSSNAFLTVQLPNQPPVAYAQSITLPEDSSVGITLSGFDPDGDDLRFTVVRGPAHGQLLGTAPDLVYTPTANYFGQDSFTFKVDDGEYESAEALVTIELTPVDDPPVAIASAGPVLQFLSQENKFVVVSTNAANALVTFDGSMSSDIDTEGLDFYWVQQGSAQAFATGIQATVPLVTGQYIVELLVSDRTSVNTNTINVDVITLWDAADGVAELMDASSLPDDLQRELIATLDSACKAFQADRFQKGVEHLQVFQEQVLTDVLPLDPLLAEKLNNAAQEIINTVVSANPEPQILKRKPKKRA